jgi:outer membrane receptor for ferrienterochelin and colicins
MLTALLAAGAVSAGTERLGAQPRSAGIRGIVVTGTPRRPIQGARIRLVGTIHAVTTDASGIFAFADLDPGQYVIQAAAIGFTTMSSPLLLRERETLEVEFEALEEAVRLPELSVEEQANHGPADWIRRKSEGRGRYITRKAIEDRRAATIADALRIVPGVRIECRGAVVCAVRMARSPRGCGPGYFMDGIPTDPAALWLTPVTQIEGIEVYSGPSETPPELEGAGSRCGAIALWTRPPPPRRPREKKPKPGAADTVQVRPDSAIVRPDTSFIRR